MNRVPSIDAERDRLIGHYTRHLERFRLIRIHRREAECADAGEQTCIAMLAELGAPGFEVFRQTATIESLDLEDILEEAQPR